MKKLQIDIEEKSELQGAILVNLRINQWGNTKRVPIEKIKKITNKKISNLIRINKGLIDKKFLEEISHIINKARATVKVYSLPFPIDGFYLVPKKSVQELCESLNEIIEPLNESLNNLAQAYEEIKAEAKEELGEDFFNENDYPEDIKTKFKITYRLFDLKPSEEVKQFDPELYKEEEKKFKNMMEETRKECINYLREGFLQVLQGITDTLTTSQRIRQDSLDRVEKFFNEFTTKDIFKDEELSKLIKSAKDTMFGISSKDLKNSEILKEHIHTEIVSIGKELKTLIENKPRKLTIKKKSL